MTHPHHLPSPDAPSQQAQTPSEQMGWLLDRFVDRTSGVTHAVLLSMDGLVLLSSTAVNRDWADRLSASFAGLASMGAGVPGPDDTCLPTSQIVIERADTLVFIMVAGQGQRAAFSHQGETRGTVDTVLGVLADPGADAGTVGFQMGHLIRQFAGIMQTPVRTGGARADIR
ncbi:roadblock/LC7 domain-containing protein [Streptomyces sp. NPDC059894]|uniref:roadblock/LC7 domain-containing protein n=1 Tax=unclassified Streptomyces TaxID=2593676 RepID=UPI00365ABAB4